MTTLAIVLPALAIIVTAVCGLIRHRWDMQAFKSMAELFVKGSSPKDRSEVVRAIAELAEKLRGEPRRAALTELLLRLFQHGQPNG